jgi:hypothetical protein
MIVYFMKGIGRAAPRPEIGWVEALPREAPGGPTARSPGEPREPWCGGQRWPVPPAVCALQ